MKKTIVLLAMICGLWQEGIVYAQDKKEKEELSKGSDTKSKEVDKDLLIVYLRLLNQKSAMSAQLESSMTVQQKQIIEILNSTAKDLQGQLTKLTEFCGKGFVFSETGANCTPATTPTK